MCWCGCYIVCCCLGDIENNPPTDAYDSTSMQQHSKSVFSAPSPMIGSRSYTVQHGPAYTTPATGAGSTSLRTGRYVNRNLNFYIHVHVFPIVGLI